MIVTDDFVFLHLHKSGGTFVNKFLQQFEPSARMIGYHLPYAELPDEYRGLPVLGTVRSPWSYYVSWYTFQASMASPNALFRLVSEGGRLDFGATITNLVTLAGTPANLDRLRSVLPENFQPRGLNLTRRCIEPLYDRETGFYAFLVERMYRQAAAPRIVLLERLRQDLPTVLRASGRELNADELQYLAGAQPTNTTRHADYREYYDAALRDLVAARDADVITQFGYEFE